MTAPPDPCAEAERLRALRRLIVTGEQPSTVRFGDEEVRYARADLAALDREIAALDKACAAWSGRPEPRTRFAKRIRFV